MKPLFDRVRARLVAHARDWWRWWSVRVIAVGVFLNTWIAFDPGAVLWIWKMLPAPLARLLPIEIVSLVSVALFMLALVMRLTRQKALEAKKESRNGR